MYYATLDKSAPPTKSELDSTTGGLKPYSLDQWQMVDDPIIDFNNTFTLPFDDALALGTNLGSVQVYHYILLPDYYNTIARLESNGNNVIEPRLSNSNPKTFKVSASVEIKPVDRQGVRFPGVTELNYVCARLSNGSQYNSNTYTYTARFAKV